MEKDKNALLAKLKSGGLPDEILNAFAKVKRESFIPDTLASYAYEDIALPLNDGTTVSQPSTIALMLKLLELSPNKENQKVLEIGSGSGYVLALISEIIKEGKVYGLEIQEKMAIKAKKVLSDYKNIKIINRSGLKGLPEEAPFDRILISASCPDKEVPYSLLSQLKYNGIIVTPVQQSIFQIRKENNKLTENEFPGFAFVPFKI